MTEYTTERTSSTISSSVNSGDTISAAELDVLFQHLTDMVNHTHDFTDDYTSNCNCHCGRGTM